MNEVDNMEELESVFRASISFLSDDALKKNKTSDDDKLRLYGCFKQATLGKCKVLPVPEKAKYPVAFAKWKAWFDTNSMSRKEAKAEYVRIVDSLHQGWRSGCGSHCLLPGLVAGTPSDLCLSGTKGRNFECLHHRTQGLGSLDDHGCG